MKENERDHSAETYLEDVELQVFRSSVHAVSPADELLRKGRPKRTLAEENGQSRSPVPAAIVIAPRRCPSRKPTRSRPTETSRPFALLSFWKMTVGMWITS